MLFSEKDPTACSRIKIFSVVILLKYKSLEASNGIEMVMSNER
jgi:hypothetical protein